MFSGGSLWASQSGFRYWWVFLLKSVVVTVLFINFYGFIFFPADYDVEDDENDDLDVFFVKTKQNISAKETIKFQKHAINSVTSRTKHLHEKVFKCYSV